MKFSNYKGGHIKLTDGSKRGREVNGDMAETNTVMSQLPFLFASFSLLRQTNMLMWAINIQFP